MFSQILMNMTMNLMSDFSLKDDFLIVALDFDNSQEVLDLIKKIPEVSFYKVGMELFFSQGPDIIHKLKSLGKKVFLDLKINDIPKTIEKSIKKLSSYDVDYITIFTKQDGIKAAIEGVAGRKTKVLNVTVLTSEPATCEDVLFRAHLSYDSGAHGIICSGLETKEIRNQVTDSDFIIVNPGIRMFKDNDDQVRIVTPVEALNAGASNIVVGRPITQAKDPLAIVKSIYTSLLKFE